MLDREKMPNPGDVKQLTYRCSPATSDRRRAYLAIIARIMSEAFWAWSAMEPIVSTSRMR